MLGEIVYKVAKVSGTERYDVLECRITNVFSEDGARKGFIYESIDGRRFGTVGGLRELMQDVYFEVKGAKSECDKVNKVFEKLEAKKASSEKALALFCK